MMKTIATLALGGLAASSAVAAPIHMPPALAKAVAAYDHAQVHGDKTALTHLLADDYMLVNSGGQIEDKAQFIADLTDPGYHLNPYTVGSPVERVWAGGAVMGGLVRLQGTSDGKAFSACIRFADIWSLRGRQWQVAYTQVARAKDGDCPAA